MRKNKNIDYQEWVLKKAPRFFVYNMIMLLLVLMHSVGYFNPFFMISINVVVIFAIILAVVMLSLSSRFVFICTCFFWLVSLFFALAHVDIWAERAGIYAYESLLVGFVVLIAETLFLKLRNYSKRYRNSV